MRMRLLLAAALVAGQGCAPDDDGFVFWHNRTRPAQREMVQWRVAAYEADHPGVRVQVVPVQNDAYKTRLRIAAGARSMPCVFTTWGGGVLYEYVRAGFVRDLTEPMHRDRYDERFLNGALDNVTFEGRIWGVPVDNVSIGLVFYNRALFARLGLHPPRTWSELLGVVGRLRREGIAPFALANKTRWTGSIYYMYLVDRLGGAETLVSAAARTGARFTDPVFVRAGRMLQELVRAGAFAEGYNGLDYDTGQSRILMYSEKAAMELIGSWNLQTVRAENPDFYRDKLAFAPFPAVEAGSGDPSNLIGTVGDLYYHVSANCTRPDDAFRMIQYLVDDEAVQARAKMAAIPPVKGLKLEDPALQRVFQLTERAGRVQLWYDQYLPPPLAEVHKETVQALLSLSMTPEEAARRMERAAERLAADQPPQPH